MNPKYRSRLLILNNITQFSLSREYGDGRAHGGTISFCASWDNKAIPGDLVALQSAPCTKWYLSWLVSKQWPEGYACEQYTLESIEDGELCEWYNVGLMFYDRKTVAAHPEWRWCDDKHAFNDRWLNACRKQRDAYIYLPMMSEFEQDALTLRVRIRYSTDIYHPARTFLNWKKVTVKQMLEFYDDAVAELKSRKPEAA
jgi:hypothetical protein